MDILWIFIILAAIVTIFFSFYYSQKYRLQSSWSGTVQGKKSKDYYYRGQHRYSYLLNVLKDTGEKLTLEVDETTYNAVEIGDNIRKEKGEFHPKKTL